MNKIYYKAQCGKCRTALQVIQSTGEPYEVVEYLKNPPTEAELKLILGLMGKKPLAIIRQDEPLFQEKYKDKKYPPARWIRILVKHPELIQRPIIIRDDKAWLARDEAGLEAIRTGSAG